MNDGPDEAPPEAKVRTPGRYSLIWLVPIIAAAIAAYLGWQTLASRGPLITITFANGAGLVAGQTRVEHKSVAIGTVESVALTSHFSEVSVAVRMAKSAAPLLTSHARFWVVRPRLSVTDISGLQTLVSGSYIAIDPGPPGGAKKRHFQGLSRPPGVRSDQPGTVFVLRAPRLGWLTPGAPVFYRDIAVGQLLDFHEEGMGKPIDLRVFVKAPYDKFVRTETHFWNTSGLAMSLGPAGVHVAVESIEALLAGGIEFANFQDAARSPPAKPGATFRLYADRDDAENAGFRDNIHYVAYFDESVAGLQPGSPVRLYGIRIGTVTGTQLLLEPGTERPRVRVSFDIQPGRVYAPGQIPRADPLEVTRALVKLGMRARIDTASLLTGQEELGLDMVPNAAPAKVTMQDGRILWPSQSGGFQNLTDTLDALLLKLDSVPLKQIGANAEDLLAALRTLAETANRGLGPVADKLPVLASELQATLGRADQLLRSMQTGYGADSQTQLDLQQLTVQASSALRSIQQLADYLKQHPASVVWGR